MVMVVTGEACQLSLKPPWSRWRNVGFLCRISWNSVLTSMLPDFCYCGDVGTNHKNIKMLLVVSTMMGANGGIASIDIELYDIFLVIFYKNHSMLNYNLVCINISMYQY